MEKTNSISLYSVIINYYYCCALATKLKHARLWACGRGDVSTPSFCSQLNPFPTGGGGRLCPQYTEVPTKFWKPQVCLLMEQVLLLSRPKLGGGGNCPPPVPLLPPALNYSSPKDHAICIFICMLVSLGWKLKSLFRYSLLFIYNVCPVFAYSLSLDIVCLLAASADIYFAQCMYLQLQYSFLCELRTLVV